MPEGLDIPQERFSAQLRPDTHIEDLDLPARAFARISKLGVKTLHDLALVDPASLLRIYGFGRTSLAQIASVLDEYFHALKPSELIRYSGSLPKWLPHLQNPESLRLDGYKGNVNEPERKAQWMIENLRLSRRALDCISSAGAKNLHDLARRFPTEIQTFGCCDDKTLIELAKALQRYFELLGPLSEHLYDSTYETWLRYARKSFAGETGSSFSLEEIQKEPPLSDVMKSFLRKLGPKKAEIFKKRFGLTPGARAQTLATVGRYFGLTRERIRQIASKAQARFARTLRRTQPELLHQVEACLAELKIGSTAEISEKVPAFGSLKEFAAGACLRLVLEALSPRVHPIDPGKRIWTSMASITGDVYSKVVTTAQRAQRGIPVSLDKLALETARRAGYFEDSEIEFIKEIIRKTPAAFIVDSSGPEEVVLPVRQNLSDLRKAFMFNYISEQGVPVHMSEILEAMQEEDPSLVPESGTPKSVINTLKSLIERDERFAWAGMSTFGLREWGYGRGITSVGGAAVHLLRSAGGPLTTKEVYEALGQLYRIVPTSVSAALNAEKGRRVGRDSAGRWYPLR